MFELAREDDFVEYFLFPEIKNNNEECKDINIYLENVLKEVNSVVESISREYIWHKDCFCLSVRTDAQSQLLIDHNEELKEKLPPHLYGISYYGENIQDEWFIVYLLIEISKKVSGIIAKVNDSDGEFLLIEAAELLPKWANPDTCEGRVFIYNGKIQLVQNSPSNSKSILPITTAISKIWCNPTLYQVSLEIQNIIEERFKEFKESFDNLFHNQIVRVSIGVAAILKEDPTLISSSVRSFCERDAFDMKACKAMRYFPPENRVRTSVKFTKCLYAMLNHSNYVPDQRIGWQLPPSGTEEYKEDLLGIKIASGFEILASQGRNTLNDNEFENNNNWKLYVNNLKKKGYFKDLIENSQGYKTLLNEAKCFFRENEDRFQHRPNVGKRILQLLNGVDENIMEILQKEENYLKKSDSESWLNISSEELNNMLVNKYGIKKLYQANGNVNANEFTKNFDEFLESRSGLDGIVIKTGVNKELCSNKTVKNIKSTEQVSDGSSTSSNTQDPNKINFDPDAFSTHIKSFLDFVIPEDNWESNSEMSDYEDEDDMEKNLEDMANDNAKVNLESYFKNYSKQMDKELANTNVGKTFNISQPEKEDDFDDIESFKPIDINVNTLKSMMDSYKSQIGGSGPVTTLLNAMGVGIEKDEETQKSNDLSETQV